MLALQVTSRKAFMSELLAGETFDAFLLEEATLVSSITYHIDGHINKEFYPESERSLDLLPYDYKPWSEIKGLCYNLIKGKHTPLSFKFVMQLMPDKMQSMFEKESLSPEDLCLKNLILTIRFDGNAVTLTTGSSYRTFVMDKTADAIWDKQLCKYLSLKGISFEVL